MCAWGEGGEGKFSFKVLILNQVCVYWGKVSYWLDFNIQSTTQCHLRAINLHHKQMHISSETDRQTDGQKKRQTTQWTTTLTLRLSSLGATLSFSCAELSPVLSCWSRIMARSRSKAVAKNNSWRVSKGNRKGLEQRDAMICSVSLLSYRKHHARLFSLRYVCEICHHFPYKHFGQGKDNMYTVGTHTHMHKRTHTYICSCWYHHE